MVQLQHRFDVINVLCPVVNSATICLSDKLIVSIRDHSTDTKPKRFFGTMEYFRRFWQMLHGKVAATVPCCIPLNLFSPKGPVPH